MRPSTSPSFIKMNTPHTEADDGFSLMELIVTVLILGIVVAIAIPFFFNAQDSARQSAVESAAKNAHTMARASIIDGSSPHGGDLSVLETENVVLSLADSFVIGDESTVCVRADWVGQTENYAISGPCDESDTTAPIFDREDDDPLYTQLTYQCPTTRSGYLGVVNIGEDTRAQIWDNSDRDGTIREVFYDAPADDFELRYETRQEILRTRIAEETGSIQVANTAIDQAMEDSIEAGGDRENAPEYELSRVIENTSELIEMEGGVNYTVRFDGEIETFTAPGHRGYGQGNIEDSLADCLVSIDHFGDDINLKNIVYLGGANLVDVPDNIPSSVKALRGTFENAVYLDDPSLSSWDVSNVHTMRGMFFDTPSFNQPLNDWDTSSLIYAEMMFNRAYDFNQDISNWDVSNVIDMNNMFQDATSFNQDISGWDTSSVKNMARMFRRAESFNQDLSSWDVSNVIDMNSMFQDATSFNQDISGWDTSSVRNMSRMFRDAESFNQDISGWDVDQVEELSSFSLRSALEEHHLPSFID